MSARPQVLPLVLLAFAAGEAGVSGCATAATGVSGAAAAGGVKSVPLSAIATVRQGVAPLVVSRAGQFPAATIGFNLAPGGAVFQFPVKKAAVSTFLAYYADRPEEAAS